MNSIKLNKGLLAHLESLRIYFRPHFHYRGCLDKVVNINNVVVAEEYSRFPESSLSWSLPLKIGAFSYIVQGSMLEDCTIGRHCSIATGVRVMSEGHPIDRVTTSTLTYGNNIKEIFLNDFGITPIQNRDIKKSKETIIGNDVWIGEHSTIKRGIKIGDGAIVAANSLVVKDVPPYAIVGGNPAQVIKYRFNNSIREKLISSQWWKFSPNVLCQFNLCDIHKFLYQLEHHSNENPSYLYKTYNITKEILDWNDDFKQ